MLAIIAFEMGFFEEQGLNVEITYLPTGAECFQAVISNSADIGTTMDVMVGNFGFSGDLNISVVASINTTASTSIVARRSAGIENPEDLRGKRLAFSPGLSSEVYAMNFLNHHNLSEDVEILRMQANTISAAIISGSVDAIAAFGPFLFNAQMALGEDAIIFREYGVFDVLLVANTDFANENRDMIIQLIRAFEMASEFAYHNVSEAQEIVARVVNLDLEYVEEIWQFHDFYVGLGMENLERVITIGELYKEYEANRGRAFPDYLGFFDFSFMEEARSD
jgi:ABC-type nitrate/sulfonate/bicarbonate transport system substrate-binding protein